MSFSKGFEGWTAYTPFLLLSDIETEFGTGTRAAIEAQLGNMQIDYIRTYSLDEYYLYGSNRLGAKKQHEVIYREAFTGNIGSEYWNPSVSTQNDLQEASLELEDFNHRVGKKRFELANHLGNVLSVISDRKLAIDNNADNQIDYFEPDIASAQDYYPGGMLLPNRVYSADSTGTGKYRFGFNGKEQDLEWNGNGNMYDYGFRIYDPRIVRFLSVDPLFSTYPFYTPYQFAGNNPILSIDLDGLEAVDTQKPDEDDDGGVAATNENGDNGNSGLIVTENGKMKVSVELNIVSTGNKQNTDGTSTENSVQSNTQGDSKTQSDDELYISHIEVDLTTQTMSITWAGKGSEKKNEENNVYEVSTGIGTGTNNCNDKETSRKNGSNCTPKGDDMVVTGKQSAWTKYQDAKWVTRFGQKDRSDYDRAVAFHYWPKVPRRPASHGCVRVKDIDVAKMLYDKTRINKTTVTVKGTWAKGKPGN